MPGEHADDPLEQDPSGDEQDDDRHEAHAERGAGRGFLLGHLVKATRSVVGALQRGERSSRLSNVVERAAERAGSGGSSSPAAPARGAGVALGDEQDLRQGGDAAGSWAAVLPARGQGFAHPPLGPNYRPAGLYQQVRCGSERLCGRAGCVERRRACPSGAAAGPPARAAEGLVGHRGEAVLVGAQGEQQVAMRSAAGSAARRPARRSSARAARRADEQRARGARRARRRAAALDDQAGPACRSRASWPTRSPSRPSAVCSACGPGPRAWRRLGRTMFAPRAA